MKLKSESDTRYNGEISFRIGSESFTGNLTIPIASKAIVIFCHGMNSSRHSLRNRKVARLFNKAGISTLLVSFEKVEEDLFSRGGNLPLMTKRVIDVTRWVMQEQLTRNLSIGYFGCGGGAAAAAASAAYLKDVVQAIVCRGGRLDLVSEILDKVKTPVLLIVGEYDEEGIALNEMCNNLLRFYSEIQIIQGASHLFEEEGKLKEVAIAAISWYQHYLVPGREKIFFRSTVIH